MCVFRCRPGFIGPLCQHLDPCLRSQCQNGAACKSEVLNGVTQYTCVCQRGFRGMSKRMHMYWKRQILSSKFKVSLFDSQAKTAPSLMLVRQVPVPTEPDVSIGITIITVPVRLASKERTAAMTLTSATSLVFASMVEPA